jgi:hypothetical protein
MINNSTKFGKSLSILENFIVDRNLPKYLDRKVSQMNSSLTVGADGDFTRFMSGDLHSGALTFLEKLHYSHSFFDIILYKFLIFIKFDRIKPKKKEKLNSESIKEFFLNLKSAKKVLKVPESNDLLLGYEAAISQAESLGQTALLESLIDNRKIILYEASLAESGWDKYLEDKDIIKFYEATESSKNLKLVWIKNFVRVIPESVVKMKKEVDELRIFDNYVILTFDPLNQMESMTKKEVEKAKDPILFGVIKDSPRLYFIADWEDEYCNLRLTDILTELGKEINSLGANTVNFYLNK